MPAAYLQCLVIVWQGFVFRRTLLMILLSPTIIFRAEVALPSIGNTYADSSRLKQAKYLYARFL